MEDPPRPPTTMSADVLPLADPPIRLTILGIRLHQFLI